MSGQATHAQAFEDALASAREGHAEADRVHHEAIAKAKAAKAARSSASAVAPAKELRRLRDDDEDARERVELAARALETARQRVITLEHDLAYALNADDEVKIADALERMRALVRKAIGLRLEADRIDREDIGQIWDGEYLPASGLSGQTIDHRIEVEENRPRDLQDLYESTMRLDGQHIPSAWERTPAGALEAAANARIDARVAFDVAHPPRDAGRITPEHLRQLGHVLTVRGWQARADLAVPLDTEHMLELCGLPVPTGATFQRLALTPAIERTITENLPRALGICAALGAKYDPSAGAPSDWRPNPSPPPEREPEGFVYEDQPQPNREST